MGYAHRGWFRGMARIVLLVVLVLALATPGFALITPNTFTTPSLGAGPVGFTYAGNMFVGTILGEGTGRIYSTNLTGGNVQIFAPTVSLAFSYGHEHYVAASLGLGGFPSGDLYVAEGQNIRHISNAGVDLGQFVLTPSIGGINSDVRGIAFDAQGSWGNKMLVTTHNGNVYSVDSGGNPVLIGATGVDTEGLDVAPLGGPWGTFNGFLFIASEGINQINAIDPANPGVIIPVTTVGSAEQLTFVPLVLGNDPLVGLYSADYPADVVKLNANVFTGLEGDLIVTGELSGAYSLVLPGGSVNTFGAMANQPEDGVFVTAGMIGDIGVPEPASLGMLGLGGLLLLRRRRVA